jgi:hypothetical protein
MPRVGGHVVEGEPVGQLDRSFYPTTLLVVLGLKYDGHAMVNGG